MKEKDRKITILKSNILRPGEKFVITDKSTDGKFLPGSTGFISFVKGVDQQFVNVVHFVVIMTKKGKGGKERIEQGDMSVPIFDMDITEDVSFMPGPDRRFFTHIEHVANNVDHVNQMDVYDFMGWSLSKARFLHKLGSKVQHIRVWPESNLLQSTMELQHHFSESMARTKEYYSRPGIIDDLTLILTNTEAKMAKCYIDYARKTADLELNAIRSLFDFYASRSSGSEIMRVLDDTTTYHCDKISKLNMMLKVNVDSIFPTDKTKAEAVAMLNTELHRVV